MADKIRPAFPEYIDNSARSALVACEQKYDFSSIRRLKPKGESVHLIAGASFAYGLEEVRRSFYLDGLSLDDSLARGMIAALDEYGDFQPPENTPKKRIYKNPEHVVRALEWYTDHWPLASDHLQPFDTANPFEFTFAIPLKILHPETGFPILMVGRQDMIAKFNRDVYGDDEKTAGSLGDTWAPSFDLDSQFTGYTWAMQESGIPAKGVVVRGISMLSKSHGFEESVQLRPAWEIHRWMTQLEKDLERIKTAWGHGEYDKVLDRKICGLYGGCQFAKLCTKVDPEPWIPMYYEENTWNPMDRKKARLAYFTSEE